MCASFWVVAVMAFPVSGGVSTKALLFCDRGGTCVCSR
jgi:hypothetical protein